ncbi:MAG: hypothetical protein U0841_24765 [Chloroflexia bacterium]
MSATTRPLLDLYQIGWSGERQPRWRWLGIGCAVGSRLLDGGMVWLCGLLLDLVLVPYSVGSFAPLLIAYVALVVAKGLIAYGEMAFGERLGGQARQELRERLSGESAQLTADLATVERLLPHGLLDVAGAALRCAIFVVILGLLHWQLALATLLIVAGSRWLVRRVGLNGTMREAAGVAAIGLLGAALCARGRLSPGGLLLLMAAAVQFAIFLLRLEGLRGLLATAAPGVERIVAALQHRTVAPRAVQRPAESAGAVREPMLLVGIPLVLLLAFLLTGLAQAGDIRPTLLFPGLRISRPPAVAAAGASGGDGASAAPAASAPDGPIWAATVAPLHPTPATGLVAAPTAVVTASPAVAEATATGVPTPTSTIPPTPTAIVQPAGASALPVSSPSPTSAPSPVATATGVVA